MGTILLDAAVLLLILTIITQIIIPLIFDIPLFFLFKKSKPKEKEATPTSETPLEKEVEETADVINKAKEKHKEVKQKVDNNFKAAEDLKGKTDKLL